MWKQTDILEKSIILSIYKKSKSITEIARDVERAKSTISKTVERMENQDLLIKNHQYSKDARKVEISVNIKRIRIKKPHSVYIPYYYIIFIPLIISTIMWIKTKDPLIFIGSAIIAFPLIFLLAYQVYILEDTIIVEKNPKITKKESNNKKIEETKIS